MYGFDFRSSSAGDFLFWSLTTVRNRFGIRLSFLCIATFLRFDVQLVLHAPLIERIFTVVTFSNRCRQIFPPEHSDRVTCVLNRDEPWSMCRRLLVRLNMFCNSHAADRLWKAILLTYSDRMRCTRSPSQCKKNCRGRDSRQMIISRVRLLVCLLFFFFYYLFFPFFFTKIGRRQTELCARAYIHLLRCV